MTAAFRESLAYLPITFPIARRAEPLRRQWRLRGQTLSLSDVTIAAVALEHQAGLLTDNRKHFPMPELDLRPLPDTGA